MLHLILMGSQVILEVSFGPLLTCLEFIPYLKEMQTVIKSMMFTVVTNMIMVKVEDLLV